MQEYILNIFDLVNVSFRTEADSERVQKAHEYAESLYQELRVHGGNLTRDRLLAILLLGITDALLQQRKEYSFREEKLQSLLHKIDDFLPSHNSFNTIKEESRD